jgi:hypothetical protein
VPKFIIERNFADKLELTKSDVDNVNRVNDDVGVRWIISFLSPDKKKTYCLYEAPTADAIREAARRAGVPADVITMVDEIGPNMFT